MGSVRSGEEFCEFFTQYRRSARRLENRESYDVPAERQWIAREILVLMRFTGDDRPLPHEVVTDPELVARHEAWIDLAMQHATPYHEYLAQDPSREDPPPGAA